jgi:predicted metal-dependent RNase
MKVTFYGGAEEVGRSCILISSGNSNILLDAGVKLGKIVEHPQITKEVLAKVDAIFVSHAHMDHVGYLPHLYSMGYKGRIYATKPTLELMNVLISDYMRISDPKTITKDGLSRMQKSYTIVEFREKVKMKDFTVSFSPSGHIVGASMITVDDGKERLIYAGDVNLAKTRLLEGADIRNLAADTLITESTYGARADVFPNETEVVKKALVSIKETIRQGGKVIIPSFAVGRAQEVLFLLDDYMNSGVIPKVKIYVDGMINKANRIYRHNVIYCRDELQKRILMSDYDPFRSPNFFPIESKTDRAKVIASKESCIIVTTGGMLSGGPVLSYLAKMGTHNANKMILVGYQGAGTPGRIIQDGGKEFEIEGKKIKVTLKVETYHLSAHADRKQLDTFVSRIKGLKTVMVVHGEPSKLAEFAEDLAKKKYRAIIPRIGTEYTV